MTDQSGGGPTTGTGLQPNIAGMLCYLLGFITGIVFLVIERDDRFVRFHALQSTFTFGALFVANILLVAVPGVGWLLNLLLVPVSIILWLVLMIKAYQGERFKLPVVGDLAESNV